MKTLAEKILDALEAETWATNREDRIRVINEAIGMLHAPHYPTIRNTEYDPERRAIAAKVTAAKAEEGRT